jgi:hypothetical protein
MTVVLKKNGILRHIDEIICRVSAIIVLSIISPILNLQSPIFNLQSPISNLQSPISNLQSPISNLQSPISNLQSPISYLQFPYFDSPKFPKAYKVQFEKVQIENPVGLIVTPGKMLDFD